MSFVFSSSQKPTANEWNVCIFNSIAQRLNSQDSESRECRHKSTPWVISITPLSVLKKILAMHKYLVAVTWRLFNTDLWKHVEAIRWIKDLRGWAHGMTFRLLSCLLSDSSSSSRSSVTGWKALVLMNALSSLRSEFSTNLRVQIMGGATESQGECTHVRSYVN